MMPMPPNDLAGRTFGDLTVLFIDRTKDVGEGGGVFWKCLCTCGNSKSFRSTYIKAGKALHCGCKRKPPATLTHGLSKKPEFRIWTGIKTRCYNPNSKIFKHYGGRGIVMSDDWKNSFAAFYRDMGDRPSGMSVERTDNNLGYSKENCEWATATTQGRNRRNNVLISLNGVTRTLTEWGEVTGFGSSAIAARLRRGWSPERALTEPLYPWRAPYH